MIKSGMGLAAILTDVLPMLADAAMSKRGFSSNSPRPLHPSGRSPYLRTGFVTIHR